MATWPYNTEPVALVCAWPLEHAGWFRQDEGGKSADRASAMHEPFWF